MSGLRIVVGPNPSRGRVAVRVEGARGPARIAVFDVLGRRVAAAAGAAWSGELAAGVYAVRAEADGVTGTSTITVVR